VLLQNYTVLGFSRNFRIILLKKNSGNRFTAAWTGSTPLAHGASNRNWFLAVGSWIYGEDFIWMKRFSWSNLVLPNPIEWWEATSDATRWRRSLLHGGLSGDWDSYTGRFVVLRRWLPFSKLGRRRAAPLAPMKGRTTSSQPPRALPLFQLLWKIAETVPRSMLGFGGFLCFAVEIGANLAPVYRGSCTMS
jgi:hypothetical protein